jgi:hypothetical protein
MLAALGLGLVGAVAPMPAAHAQLLDLNCALNFQFNFSPPLSLANPVEVLTEGNLTANFTSCLSLNQRFSDLHSATVHVTGVATVSGYPVNPCALLLKMIGTGTFEWSNGQSSGFDWEVTTDPLKNLLTLHANITSGPMTGDTGTAIPIVPIVNVDCLTAGLKTLGAIGAITFN